MGVNENIYENSGAGLLSGLRWLDMQNYRDPPPYPGHSKQVYTNQPGFRQSFSGSETSTDVSLSSTENLATSQRQEPQGEETQTSVNYHLDLGSSDGSSYSILERLGMPPGAIDSAGKFSASGAHLLNTNSHQAFYQDKPQTHQKGPNTPHKTLSGTSVTQSPANSQGHLTVPQWQLGSLQSNRLGNFSHQHQKESVTRTTGEYMSSSRSATESSFSSSSSASTLTMISRGGGGGNYPMYDISSTTSRSGSVGSGAGGTGHSSTSFSSSSLSTHQYLSPRVPPVSTYHHPHPYVNQNMHWTVGSGDSTSSSHSSTTPFSATNTTLTHSTGHSGGPGTKPVPYVTSLPPPPEYPGSKNTSDSSSEKGADIRACRSYENMDKVDTPRLLPDMRLCASSPGIYVHDPKFQSPHRSVNNSADETDQISIATKASQMVEMLTEENRVLREELAVSAVKVAKLQKFEMEIQKVHESHEALLKSSQKREALWLAMKRKLEERVAVLESQKGDGVQVSASTSEADFRCKLAEKDALISKLLSQNQELSTNRDQLEIENTQLTLTQAEQRAHVDILEAALLNAQSKVLTLEEEYRKKQSNIEKVEQLQNALTSLQSATEKQEKKEKEMRSLLEKELETYRTQEKGGVAKKTEPVGKEDKGIGMLKKMLDEKDARILQLETEIAGLEQKYVKEATLRQLSMDETTQAPKEVRLAALEKSSSDMEKLIDEAKTEKLKHMEELHQSQRKVAELEAKVKQLQTQVVEKEAMVKVFQRTPLSMARSSSLHALCHSPLHSPRPSLIATHGWSGNSQTLDSSSSGGGYREFATIRHMKTGSASAVELGRKMSMEEDLLTKVQNLNTESKSDSEDEVKLWHV